MFSPPPPHLAVRSLSSPSFIHHRMGGWAFWRTVSLRSPADLTMQSSVPSPIYFPCSVIPSQMATPISTPSATVLLSHAARSPDRLWAFTTKGHFARPPSLLISEHLADVTLFSRSFEVMRTQTMVIFLSCRACEHLVTPLSF